MARTISRDPFARETLTRQTIPGPHRNGCAWCGMTRRDGSLYEYATEPDSIHARRNPHPGLFCSKSCHDSYHG